MIYRLIQKHIKKEYEKYGLGSGQSAFLFGLFKNDGVSLDKLTKMVQVDKATTTRAIKKLEKADYVERKHNPEDKRSYTIHLTEKALELKPILKERMIFLTNVMYSDLSEEEIITTQNSLEKMSKNLMNYTKEEWSDIDE